MNRCHRIEQPLAPLVPDLAAKFREHRRLQHPRQFFLDPPERFRDSRDHPWPPVGELWNHQQSDRRPVVAQ